MPQTLLDTDTLTLLQKQHPQVVLQAALHVRQYGQLILSELGLRRSDARAESNWRDDSTQATLSSFVSPIAFCLSITMQPSLRLTSGLISNGAAC